MAQLGETFNDDSSERKVMSGGQPLPTGVYYGKCSRAEDKGTSSGGKMLALEFDILDPEEYNTRKVWDNLNYMNSNELTQKIGREAIEDLRKACGIPELSDTDQLLDCVVGMEIIVKPAEPYVKDGVNYPGKPSNAIKKYWHTDTDIEAEIAKRKTSTKDTVAAPAAKPAVRQAAAPAAAAPAKSGGMPWKKHAPKG